MHDRFSLPTRHVRAATFALVLAFTVAAFAQKQPGVTEKEIKLGSCSALDGPARFLGIQTVLGATAYLHYVNDQGGVHGRAKFNSWHSTMATIQPKRNPASIV